MEDLVVPVVRESAQGSASDSSPQVTLRQGQITRSDDKNLTVVGSDSRSSPSQLSHSLEQHHGFRHSNSNPEEDFASMSSEAQAAISQVSYGRPTAVLTTAKPKIKQSRKLLKELESFNKDPPIETSFGITGMNIREAHNTRTFNKSLNKIVENSDPSVSPPGNSDSKKPKEEQLKAKRKSTRNARSTSKASSSTINERQATRSFSHQEVTRVRTDEDIRREQARKKALRQRRLKAEGEKEWTSWRVRKDRILNLLTLIINSKPSALDGPDEQTRRRLESMVPDGHDMFMEDDIYVFAPTAAELWNFENFIAKVENIVGQKKGFMKIVLPDAMKSNYCPPHPTASAADSSSDEFPFLIRPNKTKLDRHQLIDSESVIYRVCMLGGVIVFISEWHEAMRRYQETKNRQSDRPFNEQEVHNRTLFTPRSEKEMILYSQRDSEDMYYTGDLQESHSLRHALQLGGPNLKSIQGNRFQGSRLKELGMDRSIIQLAGAEGSPFGLEMGNHAAYSLNYLHRGAPRRWLIIEPHAQKKLEELLHREVEFTARRLAKKVDTKGTETDELEPPTHPPRCDQFLGHQPFYVPKETLASHGIAYTEIVQHEGEMVVTLPFAYYQGFSEGPNVAEVIAFGNNRWETIHNTRLYRACHVDCSRPNGCPAPGQAEISEADQPSHENVGGLVPMPGYNDEDSPLTTPESSDVDVGWDREDGTSEERGVNKGKGIQKSATRKKPNKRVKISS